MKIAIVGLGYVGLPLALAFAEKGVEVVGIDTDPLKVILLWPDLYRGVDKFPDAEKVRRELVWARRSDNYLLIRAAQDEYLLPLKARCLEGRRP